MWWQHNGNLNDVTEVCHVDRDSSRMHQEKEPVEVSSASPLKAIVLLAVESVSEQLFYCSLHKTAGQQDNRMNRKG